MSINPIRLYAGAGKSEPLFTATKKTIIKDLHIYNGTGTGISPDVRVNNSRFTGGSIASTGSLHFTGLNIILNAGESLTCTTVGFSLVVSGIEVE